MAAYTTIDDPNLYYHTDIYTGNGSGAREITDLPFSPDMSWFKNRDATDSHHVFDQVRGAKLHIKSDATNVEEQDDNSLYAWLTNGYYVASSDSVNANTEKIVVWNWKAGGSGSSNSNGSITSSVSASTDSGFSIVSYTGTGANATVGHGLGAVPTVIIQKNRDAVQPWWVYHSSIGAGGQLRLNEPDAAGSDGGVLWNSTAPTSTLFSVGDNDGANGDDDKCIAYCFVEKQGYSKFGSFVGNGNDGNNTFVYTGFKPAFLMIKNKSSGSTNWIISDKERPGYNPENRNVLRANLNAAEITSSSRTADFLSNGFKCRGLSVGADGDSYVYMAFAESPFVNSEGVPNNAE